MISSHSSKGRIPNKVESEPRYSTICILISSGLRILNTVLEKAEWKYHQEP